MPGKNKIAQRSPHPDVSARWLIKALGLVLIAAAVCGWLTLCLLFWQGSWQLLYHPQAAVLHTPGDWGLAYDSVEFNAVQNGETQLHGWWIPTPSESRYTLIYLHGADGNLGNIVRDLIPLRDSSMNIFAFDYRGYGMSKWSRPSEATQRADAESALRYLEDTRHISADRLIIMGNSLGANLAVEVAAAHPEIAGVVVDRPLDAPTGAIFRDPRSRLVPAHLLVKDRYDTGAAAAALRVPSLWLYEGRPPSSETAGTGPLDFQKAAASKMLVWLPKAEEPAGTEVNALTRWLDDLPAKANSR